MFLLSCWHYDMLCCKKLCFCWTCVVLLPASFGSDGEYHLENIMGTHDELLTMLYSLQRIGTASHKIFSAFSSKSVLLWYLWHLSY